MPDTTYEEMANLLRGVPFDKKELAALNLHRAIRVYVDEAVAEATGPQVSAAPEPSVFHKTLAEAAVHGKELPPAAPASKDTVLAMLVEQILKAKDDPVKGTLWWRSQALVLAERISGIDEDGWPVEESMAPDRRAERIRRAAQEEGAAVSSQSRIWWRYQAMALADYVLGQDPEPDARMLKSYPDVVAAAEAALAVNRDVFGLDQTGFRWLHAWRSWALYFAKHLATAKTERDELVTHEWLSTRPGVRSTLGPHHRTYQFGPIMLWPCSKPEGWRFSVGIGENVFHSTLTRGQVRDLRQLVDPQGPTWPN